MAPVVDLTAVLTVNPGKLPRLLEEFDKMARHVRANEPQVLRYDLQRGIKEKNGGVDIVVVREIYASEDVQKAHIETPNCQAFIKAMGDDVLCSDVKVIFTTAEPDSKYDLGFSSRL